MLAGFNAGEGRSARAKTARTRVSEDGLPRGVKGAMIVNQTPSKRGKEGTYDQTV